MTAYFRRRYYYYILSYYSNTYPKEKEIYNNNGVCVCVCAVYWNFAHDSCITCRCRYIIYKPHNGVRRLKRIRCISSLYSDITAHTHTLTFGHPFYVYLYIYKYVIIHVCVCVCVSLVVNGFERIRVVRIPNDVGDNAREYVHNGSVVEETPWGGVVSKFIVFEKSDG